MNEIDCVGAHVNAKIYTDEISGIYYFNGALANGKFVSTYTQGTYCLVNLTYYLNGQEHNETGPARFIWEIDHMANSQSISIEYMQKDLIHREDGPAHISRSTRSGTFITDWHTGDSSPASSLEDYYYYDICLGSNVDGKFEGKNQFKDLTFEQAKNLVKMSMVLDK